MKFVPPPPKLAVAELTLEDFVVKTGGKGGGPLAGTGIVHVASGALIETQGAVCLLATVSVAVAVPRLWVTLLGSV